MDLPLEYGDDDFDFGSQMSSASSARSFSTAPSCAPITPQSGRSTPQQQASSMSFNTAITYELTPPVSAVDDYFSAAEVKPEFPSSCEPLPSTPSRKDILSQYNMDFDHASVLGSALPSHGHALDFSNTHSLEGYSFSDHLSSSPFSMPPPPYTLNTTSCDNTMWAYSGDGSMVFVDKSESPSSALSARHMPLIHDRSNLPPPPYLASTSRRRLCMEDIQQKSSVLHQVQNGARVPTKRERYNRNNGHGQLGPNIQHVASGAFRCDYPECAGRRAYKRSEHLKRHKNSCHSQNPSENNMTCQFCGHVFNRKDNWRQHMKLHTMDSRPIARTQFFPEAQAVYEAEMKRTKHRNPSKKKLKDQESAL
ncbi:hypothetical protein BX600DRAFT_507176 [Xylariales sp. PMI_506]|nr:hypothetical protein BX600DRAFT_507176 [Xylariales sp. PMI_506]